MKNYSPGDAYANLKDEMASEFTVGLNPRLKEGTTTYDSGTVATTTKTPYGYNLEMLGPNASKARASGPPRGFVPKPLTDDEIIDRTNVAQKANSDLLVQAQVTGDSLPPMQTGDEIERDLISDNMVREKVNPFVFPQATPDDYKDRVSKAFNEHMLKPQDLGVREHFEYTDDETGANVHVFDYEDGRRRLFAESPLDMYDVTDNMTPPDDT
jgi:hypothetical protein